MNAGTILIIFTLIVSIVSFCIFVIKETSTETKDTSVTIGSRTFPVENLLFYVTSVCFTASIIILLNLFLTDSFQYVYVYENSSLDLPVIYKFSALWAGKAGSFLLWGFILNICGLLVMNKHKDGENIVFAIITFTQIFIILILLVDNPFEFIWQRYSDVQAGQIPHDGSGLNPLLIDPWMVSHPPVLFMGYASATIPFAYGISALFKGDKSYWTAKSYRWIMFSMSTLGIGIFLGCFWAYKVLGWGSYWNWDPRETSITILMLIYIAYFSLRSALKDNPNRGNISSVYLIFTMITVPFFVFIIPRLYPSLHPNPIINPERKINMDPSMRLTLLIAVISYTMLYFYIFDIKNRITIINKKIEDKYNEI